MANYQITATVEKFDFTGNKDLELTLKGTGKYSFEYEFTKGTKIYYNILELLPAKENAPLPSAKVAIEPLDLDEKFLLDIRKNEDIAKHLLSCAILENKRLKFEIERKKNIHGKYERYKITSISKAE